MKIVIIGAGAVGFRIAESLVQDKHDITLIENDPHLASRAEENLDVIVIHGDGALPSVLAEAGISDDSKNLPDTLIAVTNRDEANIISCLVAKQFGVKNVFARAVSSDFTDTEFAGTSWAKALGLEMFVSPERVVAREIANLLEIRSALHVTELADGRAMVQSFEITEESPVVNKTMIDIRRENPDVVLLVVTVKRGENTFVPTATERLFVEDEVSVMCHRRDSIAVEKLFQKHDSKKHTLKRIFIVGGGRVGTKLAKIMHHRYPKAEIKLVERDAELCKTLSAELEGVTVLCGSGRDTSLLASEGIAAADGFVATTEDDEKNLILASRAHTMGATKTIALVRYDGFMDMTDVIPIDAVVDKNQTLASMITRSVRYPNSKEIVNLISDMETETMELKVAQNSVACGKTFMELDMPHGTLVGLIVRGRELMIPRGSTQVEAGDNLILFGSMVTMPKAVALFTGKD
ncbi:MAG: Trk system potassium transporter TrkA [Synergistaceae bacterium]|nr:Trk system potassium transporter TrkA [Synergistaceae bacterium]